ncbi:MAG: hypothetical protein ACLQU1_44020 [Bryobacteraceae bacterium]
MADKREYRLQIHAYSPETMPMKRLAEYVSDLAVLFGEEGSVHLVAIESGSTCPVVLVDWEAEPKVADRIARARDKEGPEEAVHAIENINGRLLKDNGYADLITPARTKLIEFPGAKREKPIEWPSINQAGEIYGVPIAVGGKGDPVPVHLLDGKTDHYLLAERAKAKAIAIHLFSATLRVIGRGRWRKLPTGVWDLERFVIEDFDIVKAASLTEALIDLRSIDAQWKRSENPLAALDDIRTGNLSEPHGSV